MALLSQRRPSARRVPAELRSNFTHLYLDIAWYGVLSGTAITFVAVYATRLGASALQLGLLTAGPALMSLVATIPAGHWVQGRPVQQAVFRSSVLHRLFYVTWVFLPALVNRSDQLWLLIGVVLIMSIPGAALAVGFNALFADAVPTAWRPHVAGVRNALLATSFMLSTLLAGLILDQVPFPAGYQIVFAMGAAGAALSSLHLAFIRPGTPPHPRPVQWIGDLASPGSVRAGIEGLRTNVGLRALAQAAGALPTSVAILRGPFGKVLAGLFAFHLALTLPQPLFPLYWVNQLHFSDQVISLGQALFYGAVLVGSTQLAPISHRLGNKRVVALGATLLCLYPALTAFMHDVWLLVITSLAGGMAWSLVGGAVGNYLLDRTPQAERTAYLAWYNLALNAAILIGSLAGPLLAQIMSLQAALLLTALVRLGASLIIWRWG